MKKVSKYIYLVLFLAIVAAGIFYLPRGVQVYKELSQLQIQINEEQAFLTTFQEEILKKEQGIKDLEQKIKELKNKNDHNKYIKTVQEYNSEIKNYNDKLAEYKKHETKIIELNNKLNLLVMKNLSVRKKQ